MKVETPQLRWHQIINPQSQKDAGANGPILSCSLLTSSSNTSNESNAIASSMGVLATAGNTEVNLWRVRFTDNAARISVVTAIDNCGKEAHQHSHILVQPQTKNDTPAANSEHTQIEHIVTLSRGTNERSINAVKFSPSGQHLVATGDGGTVVVWSVPSSAANTHGHHSFWSAMEKETDSTMKILFNQSDDVMDVSWSADSKRFTVCSLDHTMTVWELTTNSSNGKEEWQNVHRSSKDHTHYIQGVAYDPQGVYLASMGSDRMVKVYARRGLKESVVKGEMAKYDCSDVSSNSSPVVEDGGGADNGAKEEEKEKQEEKQSAILQTKVLPELLTNSTFALQNKTKTLKFLSNDSTKETASKEEASKEGEGAAMPSANNNAKRHHMFADELTLGSFFRRLAFTPDGAFLVVPAALWHGKSSTAIAGKSAASPTSVVSSDDKLEKSSFATYLFARHCFDQPYKVLTGLEKPSVVVRPNPVLFQLPPNSNFKSPLPYRTIFAILTSDTVLLYDTHHNHPLAMARGLHYAGLTDAAWANDGRTLFVTSSDGYVSILSFGEGELGEVYVNRGVEAVENHKQLASASDSKIGSVTAPCEGLNQWQLESNNRVVINTLVPKKKKKKIAPTPIAASAKEESDSEKKNVTFTSPLDDRSNQQVMPEPPTSQLQQPVIINMLVPKKKKKIAALVDLTCQQPQMEKDNDKKTTTEKKRSAENSTVAHGTTTSVHILVPKKKKKVATPSTPITIT